ncbi:MAG: hypothetical protein HZB55_09160 [Deltaproteobacteria bacterium]|nr:hypothetical protein [Deltaproteobacteria bacterium]
MHTELAASDRQNTNVQRLAASLHAAQAQGLLGRSEVVRQLLLGIVNALAATVEGNARDPETAQVLQSDAYWDHFEMDIKEALLGAFSWVDPALCHAVRDVVDATFQHLRKTYRLS